MGMCVERKGEEISSPLVISLTNEMETSAGPFFNPDCVLDIPKSVAYGYFILITGGKLKIPKTKDGKKRESALSESDENNITEAEGIEVEVEDGPDSQQIPTSALNITMDTLFDDMTTFLDDNLPEHLSISWLSITEGNIVDSCFGVKANGGLRFTSVFSPPPCKEDENAPTKPRHDATLAVKNVKRAKAQLQEAAEIHPAIRILAVEAYGKCMKAVIEYHHDMEGFGILTPIFCHRTKLIRDKALDAINEAFEHLVGSVEATL